MNNTSTPISHPQCSDPGNHQFLDISREAHLLGLPVDSLFIDSAVLFHCAKLNPAFGHNVVGTILWASTTSPVRTVG